jgi:hypothetical protein
MEFVIGNVLVAHALLTKFVTTGVQVTRLDEVSHTQ